MEQTEDGAEVTMLFTELEGATLLLAELGSRYGEVLSLQRRIMRAAFDRWDGQELASDDDGFFVVFPTAAAALDAAVEAQRAVATATWPTEGVRVRMGLHTGDAVRHEDGYVGSAVRLAARVATVAHGGQVLLTAATRRALHGRQDLGAVSLGRHRLKDIAEPEELFQLVAVGLERDFPAPRSVGSVSVLPEPATPLIGRDRELAALTDLLLADDAAVVTLLGPAGIGKTRLALAAAAAVEDRFPDGVHFVHLFSARGPEFIRSAVADALGAAGADRTPAGLREYVGGLRALLLLDGLGGVPGESDVVRELAEAGAGIRVLVTSRTGLGVPGERVHPLEPLAIPPAGAREHVAADGAAGLFVRCGHVVAPDVCLDDDALEEVGAIVRMLRGLPLAVELAGACLGRLALPELRERLDAALGADPDPEQAVDAALAVAYDLLAPDVQATFRRLGVFDGWFDVPGAVTVADTADGLQVLEHLGELLQANLLTVRDSPDGEPRLRMLRPLSARARALLAAAGEEDAACRAHAAHHLALAEEVGERAGSATQLFARDHLEVALDDVRAALAWAFGDDGAAPGDVALGLRLCAAMSGFWYSAGYPLEARRWLGLALARSTDDSPEVMWPLHALGVILHQHGQPDQAAALLERCLSQWRAAGEERGVALALNTLALTRRAQGQGAVAGELLAEAVEHARRLADRSVLADVLSNTAALDIDDGRYEAAIGRLQEVLDIDTAVDDRWGVAADHLNLATTFLRAGRDDEAEALLAEHAAGAVALGDVELTADLVETYCALHARRGDARRAATLHGVAQGMRERAELPMSEPDARWLDAVLAPVRDATDAATWERWVGAGRRLSPEDALVEAQRG